MGDVQNVIQSLYSGIVALGTAIVDGVTGFLGTGVNAGQGVLDAFFSLSS